MGQPEPSWFLRRTWVGVDVERMKSGPMIPQKTARMQELLARGGRKRDVLRSHSHMIPLPVTVIDSVTA